MLRNSQATLAIAKHLGIELKDLKKHDTALEGKLDDVQEELVEVEDVLSQSQGKELAEKRQDSVER